LCLSIQESRGTAAIISQEDATISLSNARLETLSAFTKIELENRKTCAGFTAEDDPDRMVWYDRLRKTDPAAPRH
jgi:hypothetical protein